MNHEQAVNQHPDMTVKVGKTLNRLFFRFAEKGKLTMNDKVLKLIRTNVYILERAGIEVSTKGIRAADVSKLDGLTVMALIFGIFDIARKKRVE